MIYNEGDEWRQININFARTWTTLTNITVSYRMRDSTVLKMELSFALRVCLYSEIPCKVMWSIVLWSKVPWIHGPAFRIMYDYPYRSRLQHKHGLSDYWSGRWVRQQYGFSEALTQSRNKNSSRVVRWRHQMDHRSCCWRHQIRPLHITSHHITLIDGGRNSCWRCKHFDTIPPAFFNGFDSRVQRHVEPK